MLWNWYTIDACFLAESWHITSGGMFAASCIGVALLVVCLEFMRRLGKEHDAYLLRQFQRNLHSRRTAEAAEANCCSSPVALEPQYATFRATPLQQLIRAVIHGVTLGLAYIVMLLAMYYNGYIIISIILGAILGKFLCDWMVVRIPLAGPGEKDDRSTSFEAAGPTGCCA
ncbi:Ctr copper transporter [Melanomma pulvis-pyrius CBS 109.77]|uniref:Copper transport protein n=1 Tax=Melanomma pulvis-pyrius CBS 109.77 TaxID=1314802 RepID=A0A6A6XRJ4_9PLEO|nr:Ctr copper transporter [Melanomma pulvis-pyrius CBS 109.77]